MELQQRLPMETSGESIDRDRRVERELADGETKPASKEAAKRAMLFSVSGFKETSDVVFSNEEIAEAAFEYFYGRFPYPNLPKHVCMQEINKLRRTADKALLHSPVGEQVADTYHPHRFHAKKLGHRTLVEGIKNEAGLRKMILWELENGGKIGGGFFSGLKFISGVNACWNFRPAFALYVYRKYAPPGGVVLDTCFGFGGRLVGFIASDCSTYIGFDPSTRSYEGNMRLAKDLAGKKKVVLRCLPIEDADPKEFEGTVDLAFTSPPFFRLEIYSDEETQSSHRYKTLQAWYDGFLVPMMRYQYNALKRGCFALVHINDVKAGSKVWPLVQMTIQAAQSVGFVYEGRFFYYLKYNLRAKKYNNMEPVLKFRKA